MAVTVDLGPCDCCGSTAAEFCACPGNGPQSVLHITFTGGGCDCATAGSTYALTYSGVTTGPVINWDYSSNDCPGWPQVSINNGNALAPGFGIHLECEPPGTTGTYRILVTVSWINADGTARQMAFFSGDVPLASASCSPINIPVGPFHDNAAGGGAPPCGGSYPSGVITL